MTHCPHALLPEIPKPNVAYYTGPSDCGNCTIYEKRPQVCADFHCLWKLGHGDEGDRPDKSLILFDRSKNIENAIEAKPLSEGKEDTVEGRKIINKMSRSTGMPVIVLNFYERLVKYIAGRPVE
jgi:hypothetical protein